MSDFDPGPGWREVPPTEAKGNVEYLKHNTAETVQVWIREEPLPPLPTDPWTVIRITWQGDRTSVWIRTADHWVSTEGARMFDFEHATFGRMTGWKPLAEPRAVTAKAVLDELADIADYEPEKWQEVGRKFGAPDV